MVEVPRSGSEEDGALPIGVDIELSCLDVERLRSQCASEVRLGSICHYAYIPH